MRFCLVWFISILLVLSFIPGRIIGVCSSFNIGHQLSVFGEYCIVPLYRRLGIGTALWSRCIEHSARAATSNAAIMAVPGNVGKYRKKSGFAVIPARKVVQFSGYPQLFMLNKYTEMADLEIVEGKLALGVCPYSTWLTLTNSSTPTQAAT